MHRLANIGFKPAGHWYLDETRDGAIGFHLPTNAPYPHTLYAFIVDGEVRYVGKTTRTLRHRMNNYANGMLETKGTSTNARIARRILSALLDGATVEIYAFPDTELHRYGDFHLNMSAALEDSIISVVAPDWNGGSRRGKLTAKPDPSAGTALPLPQGENHAAILALPVLQAFEVTLGDTYLDKGFFNTGIQGSQALGADRETINIYCGNEAYHVLGQINRTANNNRSPRIFGGGRLREWISQHFRRNDKMRVEVLTPRAIRLLPIRTADAQ